MPTLAAVLKTEIRRLAARELKRTLRPLKRLQRSVKKLRAVSLGQRRTLAKVERRLGRLKARAAGAAGSSTPGRPGRKMTPGGIRALRSRLKMTRKQFAGLLEVSPGSIFGWETGRTRPRGRSLARISEVRKMGVRAARGRAKVAAPPRRRARRVRRTRRGRRG